MIFSNQTKRNRFYIFWVLFIFLTVSCSGAEQSGAILPQIPPTPSSGQPVEYGASLSEWEEATQAETSVKTGEGSESGSPVIQDWPQVESSYPAPVLEGIQPVLDGSSGTNNAAASVDVENAASQVTNATTLVTLDGNVYQEIMWDALVPTNFTPDAIMAKYQDQLAQFADGSPEASDLYTQMQEEFNSAPVNEDMDGALIRLAGFIAPLEYTDDSITKFLLVPYFGACIHVPPPPINQTVLVTLSDGQGINFVDAYSPFWVMGQLTAEKATTDLAQAGYYIENAYFELYEYES